MTAYLNHSDYKATATSASSSLQPTGTRKIIDYKRKNGTGLAPRFIFECAIKLNMKPLTSATAAIIFHRFFREVESDSYDEYVRFLCILHIFNRTMEPILIFLLLFLLVNCIGIFILGWKIERRCH